MQRFCWGPWSPSPAWPSPRAEREFGVDLAAVYTKPSCDGCSGHIISFATPVDVRMGFLSGGPLSFEVRFTGSLLGVLDYTAIAVGPGSTCSIA